MNVAFASDTVLGEVKHALSHLALPTAGATSPAAGFPGELLSTVVLVANTVSLTTATPVSLGAALVLTPGDWVISGSLTFVLAAATATVLAGGSSLVAATLDLDHYSLKEAPLTTTASQTRSHPIPQRHIQVAANTNCYLVASATFSAGAVTAHGAIFARRAS
jgi:hypothetical protein